MPPKVERTPPEKIRFSENWEQILTALNLNNTYKNRTCDVFFVVETSSASSIAVEKFYYGGQLDPLSRVKPLSFEEILTNIDHFSEGIPENTFQPSDHLYFYAAKEAKKYLDDHQPIPYHLMANLIKLQILFRIKRDISLTQKEILTATNLQNERTSLIAPVEPAGAGKKKKDTKKDDKGKGKKGADLQLYDVCDSNNVFQFKATSALKKEDEKLAVYHEGLDVEEKHLFIVLVGFFDYDLFEQLLKNGVPLLAVVEIVHDELCAESCKPNSCNRSVSEEFDDLEESQSSTKCCASFGDLKGETLYKFWKQFYECFVHSDGYPEYFGNTYHMTIKPSEDTFNAETCNEKICYDTFLNLSAEIAKSNDINRQHTNYIRKLKIYDVFPEPKYVPASKLDVYNKIMDATPPECFNVSFFLSAILEQICGAQNTVFHKETPRKRPLQKHPGFKTCVVELLNKNIHRHDRAKPNEEVPYDFSPKIELEIQRRPFLVNENDEVQIIISPYRKITPDFLEVFVHNVKFIYPILRFGFFKGDEQKHLENSFELKKISDYLGVCVQELLYVIHTIFFNSMSCKKEKIIKKTSLCELFPKVVDLAPTVKKFNVALKSSSEAEEPVGYSNYPNIYEAKNIATYKWYENLSKFVMLQELKKAETDYLCLDSMYCSFDDSFLLRYHNDCDDFGINRRTWNQPLRTYVNLKDFCKHIIWEEADWLAKEEKKYLEDFNKEFLHVKDADKQIKESFYPPLVFADSDFLQSGSLKARKLLELTQPPENAKGSSASKLNLQNVEVLDDSAFEVYAFYSHQKRLKAQRSKSSSFGSLSNMNKSQSRTKSTTLLILEPPKTLRNNTPKESCTHLDKNNQPIGEDKCLKCLSITKAYKIERMSDVKSQLSLKGCYYPSFPSAADCSSIVKTSESSLRERSTSYLSKSSSDSPPFDIKLSPESSLLRYCISDVSMGSENLSIIDETTVALKREDTEQQKSLLVLFSVGSLEDKAVQKAPPGSFVSRKITEGEDGILSATKSFSKEVHKCMLEDSPRNEAYKAAIFSNAASIKGKTILDVGAGTGILSVLCAKAGAAKVFAVEASGIYKIAEEIVAENQVQQIVEVIHGAVEDISLPGDGKVDVIVSEWMGHFLVHEGMLDSVIKARDKFLRPNGLIFPENATLYSAPCSIPSMNTYWNDVSGVSMTKFCEKLKSQAPQVPRIMTVKAEHILSDPEIILWVDLREVTVDDLNSATVRHLAVVDKPGRYQGICLWFVCSFPGAQSDPVVLSTEADEPPTHWQQTVIALPVDIPVEEGAPVCYDLTLKRSEGDRRKYTLEVEMLDPDTVEHPEYCFCFKTKCILTRAVLEKYESRCFSEETTEMTPVNRD